MRERLLIVYLTDFSRYGLTFDNLNKSWNKISNVMVNHYTSSHNTHSYITLHIQYLINYYMSGNFRKNLRYMTLIDRSIYTLNKN